MCGIAGQYCLRGQADISEAVLQSQSEALRRRGPDEEGIWKNTRVGLCHRRLAILDPEKGHQPMVGARGAVLTYNGEIYNHHELRTELEARGHHFQTRSDPEVVLAAYTEWGREAWKRLNGMFAFALWDEREPSLHLVRDRFGIKPLVFSIRKDTLYFASEPSALLQCAEIPPNLDCGALLSFLLYFQPVLGDQTLFQDIHVLRPGEEIVLHGAGLRKKRWWEPKAIPLDPSVPLDETILRGKIRYLLQAAVRRQTEADVPVGAYLSGGLDSTILVGLWAQMARETPLTYTICLEGDEEEAGFAAMAADKFRTKHKSYVVSADEFFRGMEELISIRKLPLSVPNEVLIYLLAQRVAPEVKVVLTGEGADELFGGYYGILSAVEAHRAPGRSLAGSRTEDETAQTAAEEEGAFFASHYRWFCKEELQSLLSPSFAQVLEDPRIERDFAECFKGSLQISFLDRAFFFLEHIHLPALLSRLDGATMAGSVEGRVPYTDYDLVDFVQHLPGSRKFQGSSKPDKYLLRKTFADLVPAPILLRPKKAFPVPLESLFQTPPGKAALQRLLCCEPLFDLFQRESLKKWLAVEDRPSFALQAWKLLSLAMFLENNIQFADSPVYSISKEDLKFEVDKPI
ncbi:MAG: asparagine synthase (glutamine-hydrolyzing) [bacterium]